MVEYIVPEGDMESSHEEIVMVKEKSSSKWTWKILGAFFLLALALGGILIFPWHRKRSEMQPSHLNEDSAEKKELHYALQQFSSKTQAAIHLEGSYENDNESTRAVFQWKNGQGQAFAQGGFKLVNNQIVIPQNGLYFVYSQASIRVLCIDGHYLGAAEEEVVTPLSHRVWRYSDSIGVRISIMCAIRSACPSTAQGDHYVDLQGWYHAIYLGAVFHLNKGDKLWTETNQLLELETEEGKTFFGVFAL
uniref:Lymphotoxin-alpha n=1 Tax=Cynoglossus semilaevis TaxID=244447 RepID=A0A2K8ESY1_CYNSE|nr:TNF-alpha2 [Cynoglossus semilaevis]